MTGISVGDYRDPERGLELGELMREVAAVEGVERVRLSSVEVIHVKDSLLDALAEDERVCPHLHVPLQSGDDRVLASMGRNYDAAGYLDAIERLRERVPHVNLTTDVIVGYPTEDEAAFERTLSTRAGGGHHEGAHVQLLAASRHRGRRARRPGSARGEEAPQPRAARPLRGARPPPPRREARIASRRCWSTSGRRRRCPATAATTRATTCRRRRGASGRARRRASAGALCRRACGGPAPLGLSR